MAYSSSSPFMPLSGNTGGSMLNTMSMSSNINTPSSRAKLSKALPAPPPALDKPVPGPPSSATTPTLSPLPRTSPSQAVSQSPTINAFGIAAPASNSYTPYNPYNAAQPGLTNITKKPVPPIRKMPGTMTSGRPSPSNPPSSALPELPPPPPPPDKTAQDAYSQPQRTEVQPQVPTKNTPSQQGPLSPTSPSSIGPIRRRPVGNSVGNSSSTSNDQAKSPRLPDLPSFDSFGSLSNLPSDTPSTFSPQFENRTDASSDTQSQTKTVRPSDVHPEKTANTDSPENTRVTSISSILSAYSEDSSAYPGLSSSTSDGTISTNTSSYTSQGKGLPAQLSPGLPRSPGIDENEQSALSYLIDGYTDDDMPDSLTSTVASPKSPTSPNVDDYDPYADDSYYNYQRTLTKLDIQQNAQNAINANENKNSSEVTQAPVNKVQEQTQTPQPQTLRATPGGTSLTTSTLPPRSTSLARTADTTSSSDLYARRIGGTSAGPSIPELRLNPTSASAPSAASATGAGTSAAAATTTGAAASSTAHAARADADNLHQRLQSQPQSQTQPQRQAENTQNNTTVAPVAPPKDEVYVPFRPPTNPPPQSPLPTLPPKASPRLDLSFDSSPASDRDDIPPRPRSKSPQRPGLSLAVPGGLPGRNIRPSRQNSPATTPATTPRATTPKVSPGLSPGLGLDTAAGAYPNADSPSLSATMGTGLSKIEAKITSSVKRKEIPSKVQTDKQSQSQSQPKRLPTPEYDNDQPTIAQPTPSTARNGNATGLSVVSTALSMPASSGSSATAVNAPASPEASPTRSPAESVTPTPKTNLNSPLPKPAAFGLVGRDIRPAKKQPEPEKPQPQPQAQQQPQQQQFAPRTSSHNAPVTATAPYLPYTNTSAPVPTDTSSQVTIKAVDPTPTILYNGQQQQDERRLSSRGSNDGAPLAPGMPPAFPSYTVTEPGVGGSAGMELVVTPDTVFAAPPPSLTHFKCMQGHRGMFRDLNMNYPLSCQTCQTFERSVRWRCKWCYVRICTNCRDVLHTHATHDLAKLMQFIKNPASLQEAKEAQQQQQQQQQMKQQIQQQMQQQMGSMDSGYEGDGRMRSRGGSSTDLPVIREA